VSAPTETNSNSGALYDTTWRKWIPSIAMMLVSVLSYIDRNALAALAPTILKETGMNAEQYGWVVSAFSFAYMAGNPVWGRTLDRIGTRRGMTTAVSLWTFASVLHALAGGFSSFAALRALLGFGEGATFPGGLRAATESLPPLQRARGIAISYSGGALGAIVTPLIVIPIAARFGWRGAFWCTGIAGVLWISWWWFSGSPREERLVPLTKSTADTSRGPHWADRETWAFIAIYSLGAMPLGFVLYNTSLFLSQSWHQSQDQLKYLLLIPPIGWELGYFFWGWAIDRMIAGRTAHREFERLFPFLMLCSLPLALVPSMESLPLVMAELFLAMFTTSGFIIGGIAFAQRIFATRHSGLIAGLGAGSWSASVALVMPYAGRLFDRHRYDESFALAASLPVVGYIAWLLLKRKRDVTAS
jgi:ACS family hexuronate transporter-like MFS transporter